MRVPFFVFLLASLFLGACGRNCEEQLRRANYSNDGQVDEACYSASNYNNYRNSGNSYGSGYSNYGSGNGYNNYGGTYNDPYNQGYNY